MIAVIFGAIISHTSAVYFSAFAVAALWSLKLRLFVQIAAMTFYCVLRFYKIARLYSINETSGRWSKEYQWNNTRKAIHILFQVVQCDDN